MGQTTPTTDKGRQAAKSIACSNRKTFSARADFRYGRRWLTDDGGPIAHDSSWSIDIHEIQVEYTTSAIRPYALTLSYWQDFENSDLVRFDAWSSDSCSREGTVMLEEQRCRVAVFDFALNGLFNDFTGVNPISS